MYKYYLEYKGVKTEIEKEPIGWDGFEEELKRNEKSHGFGIAGSDIGLKFWCNPSMDILKSAHLDDLDSEVYFIVEYNEIEEYKGVVDLGSYEETHGDYRFIEVKVTDEGVEVTFFARQQQKVNIDSLVAFDGATLPYYPNLKKEITMPAKELLYRSEAVMEESIERHYGDSETQTASDIYEMLYKLPFGDTTIHEINSISSESVMTEIKQLKNTDMLNYTYSRNDAIFVLEEQPGFDKGTQLSIEIHRDVSIVKRGGDITLHLFLADKDGKIIEDLGIDAKHLVVSMNPGEMLLSLAKCTYERVGATWGYDIYLSLNKGHSIKISALNQTPETTAYVSMVHEALSRIVESTTNNQVTVKSDLYSRSHSDVNPSSGDYSEGMRAITNGLRIRKALDAEGNDSAFTMSFADIFKGLQPIDNIGYGFVWEDGKKYVRIEPYEWFYSNQEIILDVAKPKSKTLSVDTNDIFSFLKIGYAKYETEGTNGLDAFNTEREYRTRLLGNGSKMEQMSPFIADTYAIEATRRLADDPNSKDWRYDNDNFIIQLRRKTEIPIPIPPNYEVDLGVSYSKNILSPRTLYNGTLSPARMARRWAGRLFGWSSKQELLIYTAGKGNVIAETKIKANNELVVENGNIDSKPSLYRSEEVVFDYPLSLDQLATIKRNPYGIIMLDGEAYYLLEMRFNRKKRLARFKMRPKCV